MEFNKYTTPLNEIKSRLEGYEFKNEAFANILEHIESVTFINNLVHKDRKRVCDLPRDEHGRAKIDITHPPVFEDMDYFRGPAIKFTESGKYTDLFPNGNPNSEYMKFWREEEDKCINGVIRPSDGMYITGYNYWYWNYSPIMLTKRIGDVNEDGTFRSKREYTHARIYDHDVLYFYYVQEAEGLGKHGVVLKARGKGYSYKGGSMLTRNLFLVRKAISYAFAANEEYLSSDGLLSKAWDTVSFVNINTAFKKHFQPDTSLNKRAAYFDMTDQAYKGYLSEVIGTIVNKADKVRGKRGVLALFEEAGSFPVLLKAWKVFRSSVEDDSAIYGQAIAYGTGGDAHANFEALEELFYSPKGYRVHYLKNVFDRNSNNSICGFFVPSYMNRNGCFDKDGNSDVTKALLEIEIARLTVKYGASDPNAVTQEKAEHPITPIEALLRVGSTVFPVSEIKDYLVEIEPNRESFVSQHYVGDLIRSSEHEVVWRPNSDISILRTYPVKEIDISGGVEIYDRPKKDGGGNVIKGRYIIGVDPVDSDWGTSLFSAFVFDLWTDTIVAEFTGRRQIANDNYDIVLKMAIYYNAVINYENNLKGLFTYFDQRNKLHLLMDTPQILKDQELVKMIIGFGNKSKGTPANKQVNNWARKMLSDWMLTKHTNELGEATHETIKLRTVRSLGLLKEAAQWNPDGNFDRVSAMGMIMIARAELYKMTENDKFRETQDVSGLEDDEFLSKNSGTYGVFNI